MKLKTAKRVCDGIGILYAVAFVLLYILPEAAKSACGIALIVLTGALAFVCVGYLRCPHCRAQVHRWSMDYCPKCGKRLEEE